MLFQIAFLVLLVLLKMPRKKRTPSKNTRQSNSKEEPPTLAIEGFRGDMDVLIERFVERKSYRYEHFVKEWAAMNFGYVFGYVQRTVVNSS